MTAFNQYIKALRERQCLDIGAVAKHIGVHRHTQSNYEDQRDPPIDYLVDFAELVKVPFAEIIQKRLESSKAKETAIQCALASLEPKNELTPGPSTQNEPETDRIQLDEISHKLIPASAFICIDKNVGQITSGQLYCFLNPMTDNHFAAQVVYTDNQLKLCFDNPERNDLNYNIEDGETEIRIILRTLGLLGKVIKAEIVF